jgi:hypothetical protein
VSVVRQHPTKLGSILTMSTAVVTCRVTRLGEFSHIGRLFTLGYLSKSTKVARHYCDTFILRDRLCINFDKKCVGLHFGRSFRALIWSPWSYDTVQHKMLVSCSRPSAESNCNLVMHKHQESNFKCTKIQQSFERTSSLRRPTWPNHL